MGRCMDPQLPSSRPLKLDLDSASPLKAPFTAAFRNA